jgi:2',3'-cyclic-nucleotide 2'-phosphodiesterase (5'-nucleotidase family)
MALLLRTILFCLLLFHATHAIAATTTIRLLHVNDFHGFANPQKDPGSAELRGGATWLAAKIDTLRKERPTLLLAAGDMIQGDNWANLFKGESSIALMNLLRFDAMVVGNHEFDFGQGVLAKRISEARFPVLGANVVGMPEVQPYVIRELAGVRVAIIGLVTDDVPTTSAPASTVGLDFIPPVVTAERLVRELKPKVGLIVLLTHIGHSADLALARQLQEGVVIIGGHSHTRVEKPVHIGNSVVAQAWEHGKCLGVLDITFDDGKLVSMTGRLEDIRPVKGEGDPAVAALVDRFNRQFAALLNQQAGSASVDLVSTGVRRAETNFGNLVADIVRQSASADVGLVNGGAIRNNINRGAILVKDVYSALPFDSYVVAIKLTGRELRQALEHGVSAVEEGSGRFPQVSGISFTYAPLSPVGNRVRQVFVNGVPLDDDREYRVATIDFLAAGGDGYKVFGEAVRRSSDFSIQGGALRGENLLFSDPGHWLRDLLVDYLRRMGPVAPAVEGRIREVK